MDPFNETGGVVGGLRRLSPLKQLQTDESPRKANALLLDLKLMGTLSGPTEEATGAHEEETPMLRLKNVVK